LGDGTALLMLSLLTPDLTTCSLPWESVMTSISRISMWQLPARVA